jgi:Mrp family chromosome partitioning ATPase
VYNVDNSLGLSNLLMEPAPLTAAQLEEACAPTQVSRLFVLPSGSSRTHASSLLHSERLPELLKLAREQFDTVIIDTPPMVNIADARMLARHADALILIVRSGSTTRDAAQLAKTRFAEDGTPILARSSTSGIRRRPATRTTSTTTRVLPLLRSGQRQR